MYDASHRAKRHVRMGRVAHVSGVAQLVGVVQRIVQNNSTWTVSLNTWLVKNLQYVLSTIELFFTFCWSLGFYSGLTSLFIFLRVTSHWLCSALVAPQNIHAAKGQPCCPPCPPSQTNVVSTSSCNARIQSWLQIDIYNHDRHVHTYIRTSQE